MAKEQCGCGAVFHVDVIGESHASIMAWVREWRAEHHHEPPPAEPPTVVESGSSHERAEPFWIGDTIP